MKRLIAICITAILCATIFAAPLYYDTFFKTTATPDSQIEPKAEIENKYLMVNDNGGECVVILNQDTGAVYWVTGLHELRLIGNLSQQIR